MGSGESRISFLRSNQGTHQSHVESKSDFTFHTEYFISLVEKKDSSFLSLFLFRTLFSSSSSTNSCIEFSFEKKGNLVVFMLLFYICRTSGSFHSRHYFYPPPHFIMTSIHRSQEIFGDTTLNHQLSAKVQ